MFSAVIRLYLLVIPSKLDARKRKRRSNECDGKWQDPKYDSAFILNVMSDDEDDPEQHPSPSSWSDHGKLEDGLRAFRASAGYKLLLIEGFPRSAKYISS
jgi:hypothetical protein